MRTRANLPAMRLPKKLSLMSPDHTGSGNRPPQELVETFIPHFDLAGAIVASGDVALKVQIGQRMILGLDGQSLLVGSRLGPRERPRFEDSGVLQAQVVMQAAA